MRYRRNKAHTKLWKGKRARGCSTLTQKSFCAISQAMEQRKCELGIYKGWRLKEDQWREAYGLSVKSLYKVNERVGGSGNIHMHSIVWCCTQPGWIEYDGFPKKTIKTHTILVPNKTIRQMGSSDTCKAPSTRYGVSKSYLLFRQAYAIHTPSSCVFV